MVKYVPEMDKGILKFRHVYMSALWGGKMIARHFGRTDVPAVCSESWEISGHPYGMSVVSEGAYAGWTLDRLVKEFGREVVGEKSPFVDRFPLLFKLIDAQWPLSIQVHPNDRNAALTGGDAKTEAWYVVKASPGAVLYAGLKRAFDEPELRGIVAQGSVLLDQVNVLPVVEGDFLYVPGGMLHAIGGGCFVYEVQQSSDTTFRLYDWGRVGANGESRPLHIEESFKAIDYDAPPAKVCHADALRTPYFSMRVVPLAQAIALKPAGASFIAGFVLSGATDVAGTGESFLVPAAADEVVVRPTAPGTKLILTEL